MTWRIKCQAYAHWDEAARIFGLWRIKENSETIWCFTATHCKIMQDRCHQNQGSFSYYWTKSHQSSILMTAEIQKPDPLNNRLSWVYQLNLEKVLCKFTYNIQIHLFIILLWNNYTFYWFPYYSCWHTSFASCCVWVINATVQFFRTCSTSNHGP